MEPVTSLFGSIFYFFFFFYCFLSFLAPLHYPAPWGDWTSCPQAGYLQDAKNLLGSSHGNAGLALHIASFHHPWYYYLQQSFSKLSTSHSCIFFLRIYSMVSKSFYLIRANTWLLHEYQKIIFNQNEISVVASQWKETPSEVTMKQ